MSARAIRIGQVDGQRARPRFADDLRRLHDGAPFADGSLERVAVNPRRV
jgi:hypothetical protein